MDDIKDLLGKVNTYNKSELNLLGIDSHLVVSRTKDKYVIYNVISDSTIEESKTNIEDLETLEPSDFFVLFKNPHLNVNVEQTPMGDTSFNTTGFDSQYFPSGFETTGAYYDFKPPDSPGYSAISPAFNTGSPDYSPPKSKSPSYSPDSPKYSAASPKYSAVSPPSDLRTEVFKFPTKEPEASINSSDSQPDPRMLPSRDSD